MVVHNELRIKKFLRLVLSVHFTLLGLIILSLLGFDEPVLRPVFGCFYLAFIPGILILRIIGVRDVTPLKYLVFTVGLSLAFTMFIGFFVNLFLPLFGIVKPIAVIPIVVTFNIITLFLCFVAYKLDRRLYNEKQYYLGHIFSPSFLFVIMMLLIGVLGIFLVRYHQNNSLLLISVLTLAIIVGFIVFSRFIPRNAYPMIIVIITIILVYSTKLITSSLVGYDVQAENILQASVLRSGFWDPSISGNVNSSLSVAMLCPIYSLVLNMDSVWIFKAIYPLFFCLVPIVLFSVYQEQIDSQRAFLSVFFLMSVILFFGLENRQMIGELFFVLLILVMVDMRLTIFQKSFLFTIFSMSLPVSHYGLTYICFAFFILGWLTLVLIRNGFFIGRWKNKAKVFNRSKAITDSYLTSHGKSYTSVLTGNRIALFVVFALTWSMYTTSGSAFITLINIWNQIYSNLSQLFNPIVRESLVGAAIGLDFASVSTLGKVFRVIQYCIQVFIIIGFIRVVFYRKHNFRAEYISLIIISAVILFACIVVPYFSNQFEVERFYRITLLLLAPLCILGGEFLWRTFIIIFRSISSLIIFKKKSVFSTNLSSMSSVYLRPLTIIILIPYFLFNSGFIFEISKSEQYNTVDIPSSVALSSYRVDMKTVSIQESRTLEWLSNVINSTSTVYADEYGRLQRPTSLMYQVEVIKFQEYDADQTIEPIPEDSFVYLRNWNIVNNEAVFMFTHGEQIRFGHISFSALPELLMLLDDRSVIYNNGGGRILGPK